jgi:hypothetical protein
MAGFTVNWSWSMSLLWSPSQAVDVHPVIPTDAGWHLKHDVREILESGDRELIALAESALWDLLLERRMQRKGRPEPELA